MIKETKDAENKYIIGALVTNRPGILTKITGLFARRAYNIESLTVCTTEDADISRMTIVLKGTEYNMYQMIKQMDKLEDVHKIGCANELSCVYRELMLAKVNADAHARTELFQIAEVYKAHVVDLSMDTLILELTGDGEKLDAFTEVIRPYGILEMQRTGTCALARGRHVLKDRDCYSDHIF